eukprot:CAMPEP_0181233412 /NCGR_PEP_ID=MMETSP1096-20121128/36320_1 /TAXON_ID=156174 ORGANISM="Chrysochromulina ericina, Strain CCMP281" /NCGR_SAMPLE_ID=MMETSP1096 /ASSEMBLY_ACC=CAM_ASM_000453 /LENGTH=437 /DNA_ID=CAMNT_0023327907 /DNA_START=766 /DNA_END=2080 /DNA_ORIENTATION=-
MPICRSSWGENSQREHATERASCVRASTERPSPQLVVLKRRAGEASESAGSRGPLRRGVAWDATAAGHPSSVSRRTSLALSTCLDANMAAAVALRAAASVSSTSRQKAIRAVLGNFRVHASGGGSPRSSRTSRLRAAQFLSAARVPSDDESSHTRTRCSTAQAMNDERTTQAKRATKRGSLAKLASSAQAPNRCRAPRPAAGLNPEFASERPPKGFSARQRRLCNEAGSWAAHALGHSHTFMFSGRRGREWQQTRKQRPMGSSAAPQPPQNHDEHCYNDDGGSAKRRAVVHAATICTDVEQWLPWHLFGCMQEPETLTGAAAIGLGSCADLIIKTPPDLPSTHIRMSSASLDSASRLSLRGRSALTALSAADSGSAGSHEHISGFTYGRAPRLCVEASSARHRRLCNQSGSSAPHALGHSHMFMFSGRREREWRNRL